MIAIEEAVTAFADLVEQLAQTGGVFDEADLYRVLKNREAEQWKTGYPEKSGEYIVQIHGARVATTLDFSLKRDEDEAFYGYKDNAKEIIACEQCKYFQPDNKLCEITLCAAEENGYCYWAERKHG